MGQVIAFPSRKPQNGNATDHRADFLKTTATAAVQSGLPAVAAARALRHLAAALERVG